VKRLCKHLALCLFLAGTMTAQAGRTVMVDTNTANQWVVVFPTNFWGYEGETMMHDIAEGTFDTMMPDYLDDYYLKSQSDTRYRHIASVIYASEISLSHTNLSHVFGYTVQQAIEELDALSGSGTGTVSVVNNYYSTSTGAPPSAAQIPVAFTPSEYTPAAANVEQHLISIDSRLAYLEQLIISSTNYMPPTATGMLASVTIAGANLAYENTDETYTLTATFSDGSSSNVSSDAAWSFVAPPPTGTVLTENLLEVGDLRYDSVVTLQAQYSHRGVTRSDTHLVTLADTNPPVLSAVSVVGTNRINEGGSAAYSAWARYSDGVSNDVSTLAAWGFVSAPPSGTAFVTNLLTVGAVGTDTVVQITAAYASGGIIGTGTQAVTIASTDQDITLAFTYSGTYNLGTLHVEAYNNRFMQGYPLWSTVRPNVYLYGGTNFTFRLPAQYSGQTWWAAWHDTDGNGVLNGVMGTDLVNSPTLRKDEPHAIALGQTATTGITLTLNQAQTVTFPMVNITAGIHWQGWRSSDLGGALQKRWATRNMSVSGAPVVLGLTVTNRTYVCEQDWNVFGTSAMHPAGFQSFLYDVSSDGRIEGSPINGIYTDWSP
jgi:hypothetical protein